MVYGAAAVHAACVSLANGLRRRWKMIMQQEDKRVSWEHMVLPGPTPRSGKTQPAPRRHSSTGKDGQSARGSGSMGIALKK